MLFNLFSFRKFKIISKKIPIPPLTYCEFIHSNFISSMQLVRDELQHAMGDVPHLPTEFKSGVQLEEERGL